MNQLSSQSHVAIIGAGFFGCVLADYLANTKKVSKVTLFDSEALPLDRASKSNQARIHRGYHYPRSLQTAWASSQSYFAFRNRWPKAVFSDFKHLYAVARNGSFVSSKQFQSAMDAVGAPLNKLSDPRLMKEFDNKLIEQVFEAQEEAFNFSELRNWAQEMIGRSNIDFAYKERVTKVSQSSGKSKIECLSGLTTAADVVFNVTYAGLETIEGLQSDLKGKLVYEMADMPLVGGEALTGLAVTVMDGPFFSLMPYPGLGDRSLRTISHVEYTPRRSGTFEKGRATESQQEDFSISRTFDLIRRDAARFVPALADLSLEGNVSDTKAILKKSDRDDSRPILFLKHTNLDCYSILGGKLDNVFDMIKHLEKIF